MVEEYSKEVLKICVALISQEIGFTAIQSTPLQVLTDLLGDYIKLIGRRAHNYAELFNTTTPNLGHVSLAFKDLDITVAGLEDYAFNFKSPTLSMEIPKYPIPRESHLIYHKRPHKKSHSRN